MPSAPLTPNEEQRLEALRSYHILDTATEQDFDELTELAAAICDTPISLISLVDEGRQWFKSHHGLDAVETKRSMSFCAHAILDPNEIFIVEDTHLDERFKDNPLVTGDPHINFYAGIPLIDKEGYALGSLCVIDQKRRSLDTFKQKALRTLAKQVVEKLEHRRMLHKMQEKQIQIMNLQASMEETQVRLNVAIASAKLGLWTLNFKTNELELNEQFRLMFGLPLEGKISLEQIMAVVDPDYISILQNAITDGINLKQNADLLYPITHAINANRCWIKGVGCVLFDNDGNPEKFIGVNIDVTNEVLAGKIKEQLNTELQFANNKLRQSEEQLQLTIASADLGTWYIDAETREFMPSTRLKELFGYLPHETMPYEAAVMQIAESHRDHVKQAVENAITKDQAYDLEYPIISHHDGKLRWVRATGKLYKPTIHDGAPFLSGTIADITQRKLEDQRRMDFIGIVSHELRSPLTSLNGYMQILHLKAKKAGDETTLNITSKGQRQVEKMKSMITGFLDVARLGENQIALNRTTFDMANLIKSAEEESMATITSHEIIYHPVEFTPVVADMEKIEQVLINFINNAVKYSPEESTITVDCIARKGWAYVSVSDVGMGISPKDQPFVFERFFRVDSASMNDVTGFGIGLYLCNEIIQRHGGHIGVDSTLGKGSTFWFELPISQ